MNIITLVARSLIACFGFFLLVLAMFFYEDEQSKLQSRLEELWIRIDDLANAALARHTAFLKETLRLVNTGFDKLFGEKLLSMRSIAVTFSFSLGSLFLLLYYSFLSIWVEDEAIAAHEPYRMLAPVVYFLVAVLLGTSSLFVKGQKASFAWSLAITCIDAFLLMIGPAVVIGGWTWWDIQDYWTRAGSGSVVQLITAFVIGICCDLFFIAINRALIKYSAQLNSSIKIAFLLACNLAVAFGYIAPYFALPVISDSESSASSFIRNTVNLISSTNLIAAILASGIVVVLLIAALHRLFWPLLSRPVYALARYRVLRKPAMVLSIGITLLTWAIPAWEPLWKVLGKL